MDSVSKLLIKLFAGLGVLFCCNAHAGLIGFALAYSGQDYGNSATATGFVVFDDSVLLNPLEYANVDAAVGGIVDFTLVIANATAGNGAFGISDVTNWVWIATQALDYSIDLVGQVGFADFNWCALDFDGCTSPAPGGVGPFTIRSNAENGDELTLVSMTPFTVSVPAPPVAWLLLLALAALVLSASRRTLRFAPV